MTTGMNVLRGDPKSILDGELFDVVLFDCDGVLFQSAKVLPGAIETVSALKARGIQAKFVTNSSTRSREQLFEKLRGMGFKDIEVSDCFPSGVATAHLLRTRACKRVYVIGEEGLMQELRKLGIEAIGGPDDSSKMMNDKLFIEMGESENTLVGIDSVVVGYDQKFNYFKLACASLCFQKNPNCSLIATNDDQHDRIGGQWLIPVNGCALESVKHAVNRLDNQTSIVTPMVVGKPNSVLGDLVLSMSGLNDIKRERVLMVGDKIETDIALAKNCGFKSCLVLSGCATPADVKTENAIKPDYVLRGLCDIADSLG
jgi:phosphoglycolate/pyridoxal phosphate phosphatase family enzyme